VVIETTPESLCNSDFDRPELHLPSSVLPFTCSISLYFLFSSTAWHLWGSGRGGRQDTWGLRRKCACMFMVCMVVIMAPAYF